MKEVAEQEVDQKMQKVKAEWKAEFTRMLAGESYFFCAVFDHLTYSRAEWSISRGPVSRLPQRPEDPGSFPILGKDGQPTEEGADANQKCVGAAANLRRERGERCPTVRGQSD